MHERDIRVGKKYWVRTREEASPQPVCVVRMFPTDRRCFQCAVASGGYIFLFAGAFIRPVEPEPVAPQAC